MRLWTSGLIVAALAAGVAGCGTPTAELPEAPAPLAVSGDELLVTLSLPGMS